MKEKEKALVIATMELFLCALEAETLEPKTDEARALLAKTAEKVGKTMDETLTDMIIAKDSHTAFMRSLLEGLKRVKHASYETYISQLLMRLTKGPMAVAHELEKMVIEEQLGQALGVGGLGDLGLGVASVAKMPLFARGADLAKGEKKGQGPDVLNGMGEEILRSFDVKNASKQ